MKGICPIPGDPRWDALVQMHQGDEIKAFQVWANNNYKYPKDVEDNYNSSPDTFNVDDSNIKEQIVDIKKRAIKALDFQVRSLKSAKGEKAEYLKEKYEKLIESFQKEHSMIAIMSLIKVTREIINSQHNWLETVKGFDNPYIPLNSILETIETLNFVGNISPDDFKEYFEEEFNDRTIFNSVKQIEDAIGSINANMKELKKKALKLAKEKQAEDIAPFLTRIDAFFERRAEMEFMNNSAANFKNKKEMREAKKAFVKDYMFQMAGLIQSIKQKKAKQMLELIEDVSWLEGSWVAPKDMNHDLVAYITEILDKEDYEVKQSLDAVNAKMNKLHKKYIDFVKPKSSNYQDVYGILLTVDESKEIVLMDSTRDGYAEFVEKYKNTPVMEFYEFLQELKEDTNKELPSFFRLHRGFLPVVDQSITESLYQKGIVSSLRTGVGTIFKTTSREEDIVDSNVVVNIKSAGEKIIPIRYRSKNVENRSLDLPTILLLDYHNAMSFHSKLKVSSQLNLLKRTVAEGRVSVRDNSGITKLKATNELRLDKYNNPEDIAGLESNIYKLIEGIIEHRVYDIGMKGNTTINKAVKNIKKTVSAVNMGINIDSALTNWFQGQFMILFDSFGDETGYYTVKNRTNATAKFSKDWINVIQDINNQTNQSKTNLLLDLMGLSEDLLPSEYYEDNILKKVVGTSPIYALNRMSEYGTKVISMYSVLDNIKVLDANGDFLDKDGNPTKDREKAISIDDAYDVKDGRLELKFANVSRTERTEDTNAFPISRLVKRVARHQFGNQFDHKNKSQAERMWYGALFAHMRGWLLPGIYKHWKGFGSAKVRREDLTMDQLIYNQETGRFEEGVYTTTFRFLFSVYSDWKALKRFTLSESFKQLSDQEQRNIRYTIAQTGAIFATFALFWVLFYDADDEPTDDPTLLYASYISRRIYSELFSFTNPRETFRTFTTPAVSVGFGEKFLEAVGTFLAEPYYLITDGDLSRYEQGIRKGDSKLFHKLIRLIPIANKFDKDTKEQIGYLMR